MRAFLAHFFFTIVPIISFTPRSYCAQGVKLDGLTIDICLKEASGRQSDLKTITHLTALSFTPNKTALDKEVSCKLLSEDETASSAGYDTDEDTLTEDSVSKTEQAKATTRKLIHKTGAAKDVNEKKISNRSRRPPLSRKSGLPSIAQQGSTDMYKPNNNYLMSSTYLSPSNLRDQLSIDAFDIVGSETNDQTKKSTVCLCVMLRDKYSYVKKFSFHSGDGVMSPAMRRKSNDLGYDVIQAEHSHAEGQLVQFLLHRTQTRPGWYTHILGIGCSRCYCAECDCLFRMLLSRNYHQLVTAANFKKGEHAEMLSHSIKSEIIESAKDAAATSVRQSTQTLIKYDVVKKEKAVADDVYDNYFFPKSLRDLIDCAAQEKTDWDQSGKYQKYDGEEEVSRFIKPAKPPSNIRRPRKRHL